jgi:hypothetical protein
MLPKWIFQDAMKHVLGDIIILKRESFMAYQNKI